MPDFQHKVLAWFDKHGRHELPWQQQPTPYRVWISEIMLQQTQVNTVIPYFQRFMQRFPEVRALAAARVDEVLHLWSGLGYYSRARNLHRCAAILERDCQGVFPRTVEELERLPGIGRSTAGAILSLSMNLPCAVLDGNIKRVLCRYFGIEGWPGQGAVEKRLWQLAQGLLVEQRPAAYTQAMMDLGALVCVRGNPRCAGCPVSADCAAYRQGRQQTLPHSRPRRPLPVKQLQFIMIEAGNGDIMLQRRPPSGIWGGLWGFPECPLQEDAVSWVREQFGYRVSTVATEPVVKHSFTHFQLQATPVRLKLKSAAPGIRDRDDLYWFRPGGDNKILGMAAPVKKLVEKLA